MNTQAVTMVRVYIREGDKAGGHNLMRTIFEMLHDEYRVRGVTVFRGVAGFGSKGEVHADDLLRLNVHLPLVIEFFDTPSVVDAVLPRIAAMLPPGHIVHWPAQCAGA
ncbi:MAG: DUF190 domain-containing protein [Thiomonas sp.]